MAQYFDQDFFKFTLGFVIIVSISISIILGTKYYESTISSNTKAESSRISNP